MLLTYHPKSNLLMKVSIFIILSCVLLASCQYEDCESIQANYESYNELTEAVKSHSFKIEEDLNTSKSSWIRHAEFYSCDGSIGYLIITTDKKEYSFTLDRRNLFLVIIRTEKD